jgi:hypothetical protein
MRVMHTLPHVPRSWTVAVALGVAGLSLIICPKQTATAAPAVSTLHVPASTNVAPQTVDVPMSIFVIPATAQEGKDPFFPQSTRLHPAPPVTGATPPPTVPELVLKGVSGSANRRLAIINNRTFARGEEGDVMWNGTRVRVKCTEIESDSVQVTVNGQVKVLRLNSRF